MKEKPRGFIRNVKYEFFEKKTKFCLVLLNCGEFCELRCIFQRNSLFVKQCVGMGD